ncbi:DNA polymerase III subunit gamma/tau, partial [Stomatohabitans albus]|uniref:DNA polymerase III subunit gamma/tau n=1 Tax=Stomatohabitans albus TaxID=3110766 RepID=UPI00300C5A0B
MAHVSLYRKYRPDSFADVVGQDHVTETLARAVDTQSWHHAYLFCGPRGTGKTSSARLLAMGLNASIGPTSHPDPNDPNVVAIREGSSPDVIEIDAASNSGVDDVRDLRDKINYSPTQGRLRIYIVDECHMLSNSAWNAFLKTIEEPPGHVVFIFATTEPHKVLPTVLSRTQRFDFRRVSDQVLTDHCKRICVAEQVTITDEALAPIVRAGDGSVRDTLSVLDQVIAFTGNTIDVESVNRVLGTVPSDLLDRLVNAIARADVADAFALVGRVADQGIDLRQFALDAQNHLRELLILSAAPDAGLIEGTPERLAALQAQAASADTERLLFAVEILNDAQVRMRAGNTRLPLEVALAKAVLNDADRAKPVPRLAPTPRTHGAGTPAPTASTQANAPSQQPSPASTAGTEPNTQQPHSSSAPGNVVATPSEQAGAESQPRAVAPEPQEHRASEEKNAQAEQNAAVSVQPDDAPQSASERAVPLEGEVLDAVAEQELAPQRESLFSADEDAPAPLPSTQVSPPPGQDVSPDEPVVESEPAPPEPAPEIEPG